MFNYYIVYIVKDDTINCNCNNFVCRHWDGEQYVRAELRFKFVESNVEKVINSMKKNYSGFEKITIKTIKSAN